MTGTMLCMQLAKKGPEATVPAGWSPQPTVSGWGLDISRLRHAINMRFSPSGVSWFGICSPLSQKFITPLNCACFFTFLPTLSGTEIQPLPRRRARGVPVARPGCRPGVPGGSLASQNTKTARFEGSMASIKIPFFQDKKPQ